MQKDFSKVLDETTQAIEDSINHNIVTQMKEMDAAVQQVISKATSMDTNLGLVSEKNGKIEETLNDHIDLIETLNRKLDKQSETVEENRKTIIEKLGVFESGVIQELKEATSHFSFKAYEESFRKIEQDMDTFYKELLKMREEGDVKTREMNDWRTKMSGDLIAFYKKYDTQSGEFGMMNKLEKEQLNNTLNEISDSIGKSKLHSLTNS